MNEVMQWYERDMTLAQAMDGIETNMWAAVRNYIAVGFYLKAIRDRKLFQEAGYQNFEEFVRDKYDRDKGWASRCIKVNDQLSKGGNSPVLAEEYREYKVSQLVELAYLTEEQRIMANPDMTVKQLQAIRKPEPQLEKEVVTLQPELKEHEGELSGKVVTSQLDEGAEREPEVIHFTAGNRTIDNAYGATIAAVVRAYLDVGYSRPEKECEVTTFGLVYKVLKRQDVTVFYTDSGRTVFDIENARLEEEYQYWHGTKEEPELVTSQVEPEPGPQDEEPEPEPELPKSEQAHPEKSGKCIHRPEFDCTLEEAHKLIPGTGEDCSRVCCWECVRRGDCELECYSSQRRPEHLEPPKTKPDCLPLDTADTHREETAIPSQEECVLDFYQHHMSKPCAQAANDGNVKLLRQELIINHGEPHNSGSTEYGFYQCGPERIHFQDNMCETFLSLTWGKYVKELLSLLGSAEDEASEHENDVPGMPESQDTVIDGEFTEISETEEDIRAPEEPMTELQIAQDELERAKKLLNDGLKCDVDENDIHIRRLKIKVCALASYVCDLDDIVNPPKPEQPELPLLKNNDQRAAFVDAYETWPLWIETKQTGERYYRYDLEDGTSMVVKVYHAMIFDGYAPGSYEAKYHDGYGRHEYYLLRDGKFFRDCDTNRSLLIEKLKEIQKVKKGCNQN